MSAQGIQSAEGYKADRTDRPRLAQAREITIE
jgi:hypothetical protein